MPPKKNKGGNDSLKIPYEELTEPPIETKSRTINICLENYQNIKPFFPVADIQTNIQYTDNTIGQTTPIPITDDNIIPISQSFSFTINANNPKELDALISTPATLLVDQIQGSMDKSFYPQMQLNTQLQLIPPTKSFDSIVSMYEALNVTRIGITEDSGGKKKGKKGSTKAPEKSNKADKVSGQNSIGQSISSENKTTPIDVKPSDASAVVYEPTPFGMCCLDFLPLFYGQKKFSQVLLIKPIIQYNDNNMLSFKAHPKILVTVSMEEDLDLANPTFLNFTLETIYNVPDLMLNDMEYWVCSMLPMLNGKKAPLLFTNPTIVTETLEGIAKLWPGTTRVYCDANATLYRTPISSKDIICKFDDGNVEKYINEESPRVQFVMIKRHLMLKDAVTELVNQIRVSRKLVLEFYVCAKEKTKKNSLATTGKVLDFSNRKPGKPGQFLHLMAILDVAVLLYPGVQRVRLAAPLTTFSQEEAAKYCGLEDSFFVPNPKKEAKEKEGKEREGKDSSSKKDNKSDKSSKGKADKMTEKLPSKPAPYPEPEASVPIYNEDGKPCFVVIAIDLSRALVPKRNIDDLKEELALLLREREENSALDRNSLLSTCMTYDYYQEVLGAMIADLNTKFSAFIANEPPPSDHAESFNQTAIRFTNFLHNEGIYDSYISAITKATSLLVGKTFHPVDDRNSKEFQRFVGKVFVFLLTEMNITVNKLMCQGMEPVRIVKKTDDHFFYAKEATDTSRLDMAERYFLERICNDSGVAEYWFDYGIYLLELREEDKAYECMKEALLLRQQHKYSLLVLGVLLSNKGRKEDAETCFLNLLARETTWTEGWAILYLFYQKTENYEGMDRTIAMAAKYRDLTPPSDYFESFDELVWTSKICPQTIFFRAAMLLLKMRLYEWSELALAKEINTNPGLVHYLLAAICYYKKLYSHAMDHIEQTLKYYGPDYAVASLTGHCLLALNRKKEAKEQLYFAMESFDRPVHLHLVSINLANLCIHFKENQEARKIILLACKYNPTPYTWFLAGTCYYEENDLVSAEECFSEGNAMDNKFAEIWGYLALVNFKLGRENEAEICLDQALKNQLSDQQLLKLVYLEKYARTSLTEA